MKLVQVVVQAVFADCNDDGEIERVYPAVQLEPVAGAAWRRDWESDKSAEVFGNIVAGLVERQVTT